VQLPKVRPGIVQHNGLNCFGISRDIGAHLLIVRQLATPGDEKE